MKGNEEGWNGNRTAPDVEARVIQYAKEGLPAKDISGLTKVSVTTVYRIIKDARGRGEDLPNMQRKSGGRKPIAPEEKGQVIEYSRKGLTADAISRLTQVSVSTVRRILKAARERGEIPQQERWASLQKAPQKAAQNAPQKRMGSLPEGRREGAEQKRPQTGEEIQKALGLSPGGEVLLEKRYVIEGESTPSPAGKEWLAARIIGLRDNFVTFRLESGYCVSIRNTDLANGMGAIVKKRSGA